MKVNRAAGDQQVQADVQRDADQDKDGELALGHAVVAL
jgi:hypothetical protein